MTTQIERRRYQRFPLQVELSILPPCRILGSTCLTRDVSSGGVYFYADAWDKTIADFDFYAVLPKEITLGSPVTARCSAVVLRVDHYKMNRTGVAAKVRRWTVM